MPARLLCESEASCDGDSDRVGLTYLLTATGVHWLIGEKGQA